MDVSVDIRRCVRSVNFTSYKSSASTWIEESILGNERDISRRDQMRLTTITLLLLVFLIFGSVTAGGILVDHAATAQFDQIPSSVIASVTSGYKIYYGHTSHGSQVISGITYIHDNNNLYASPVFHEVSDDLGSGGDTTWVADIRNWLAAHPDYNMVMMSWCGGVSISTETDINIYLDKMNQLENQYPTVTFVYMTGHLDGTGPTGTLYQNNNVIRAYCSSHNKVLYDFADIESYDPDNTYFPNESDACNWCYSWCSTHTCCSGTCAHSHCFNCYRKGQAWWWMMATLEGWHLSLDVDDQDTDILPAEFELGQNYPNPFNPTTEFGFTLPRASHVELNVYNIAGQKVATIADLDFKAGVHSVTWDASGLASGVYLYRLDAGQFSGVRKMLLLK